MRATTYYMCAERLIPRWVRSFRGHCTVLCFAGKTAGYRGFSSWREVHGAWRSGQEAA